jgi:hypothetical protein
MVCSTGPTDREHTMTATLFDTIDVMSEADDEFVEAFVTGRFEACATFVADGSGAAVCAECGWLDDEHGPDADVHTLPRERAPLPATATAA